MKSYICEPTTHTPLIECHPNGNLKIEGRAIPEDAFRLFEPVIDFAKDLKDVDVNFHINLEYINTAASKKMMELLKIIDANSKIGEIIINWHFEEGDDDSIETAEIYEASLYRSKFIYHEHEENADF